MKSTKLPTKRILELNALLWIGAVTTAILCVPLIAMQFTTEVDWKLSDFIIIGALLVCAGLVIQIINVKVADMTKRLVLTALVLLAVLLIWADLAVGIFNTPFSGS